MRQDLPAGLWCSLRVPLGTSELEVTEAIAKRTGIQLDEARVSMGDVPGRDGKTVTCVISFSDRNMVDVLSWAMSDDLIGGMKIEFVPPFRKPR